MALIFFTGGEPPQPGLFMRVWDDPVWSKVIGTGIYALLTWAGFMAYKHMKRDLGKALAPQVDVVTANGASYPLKIYVEMRNSSKKCIDVHLVDYKKKNIALQRFTPRTLQLFFQVWSPEKESVDRIAVYPGQRFRAWLGADPNKHTEQQVRDNLGSIGTLIIAVDGKEVPIEL
jgi:hypothetical protein